MDNLAEALFKFADDYEDASQMLFANSDYAHRTRGNLAETVQAICGPPFNVTASVGKGVWAHIPWVAAFHPLETNSAQHGFYVVYLLSPQSKELSLSLNQGVTEVEKAFGTGKKSFAELRMRADVLRNRAGPIPKRIASEKIDLGTSNGKAKAYQAGHAFGRTYSIQELRDGRHITSDLRAMLDVYQSLVEGNGFEIESDTDARLREMTAPEAKKMRLHQSFDRLGSISPKVKKAKGATCEACGLNFQETYGDLGAGYIEAHHLRPFSELEANARREVNLINDFAVLCANCHRMIHRLPDPSDLAELRKRLAAAQAS